MTSSPTLGAKVISRIATVCFFTPFVVLLRFLFFEGPFGYTEACILQILFDLSFVGSPVFSLIQVEQAMKSEGNRRFLRGGLIKFFVTVGILLLFFTPGLICCDRNAHAEVFKRNQFRLLTLALKNYEDDHGGAGGGRRGRARVDVDREQHQRGKDALRSGLPLHGDRQPRAVKRDLLCKSLTEE